MLIVAPEPFYEDRGTPIAVGQLAAALATLEYRIELITYPIGDDVMLQGLRIERTANLPGLKHVPIGFSLRKVALDLLMLPTLWRKLRRDAYLIVHALEEMALPVIWLCRRRGIPVIYDMQSSIPDQLHSHWLFGTRARAKPAAQHRALDARERGRRRLQCGAGRTRQGAWHRPRGSRSGCSRVSCAAMTATHPRHFAPVWASRATHAWPSTPVRSRSTRVWTC